MAVKHFVIYIPGLADRTLRNIGQAWLIRSWRWRFGVHTSYFTVGWSNHTDAFDQRLAALLAHIKAQHAKGYSVSIVAASAGASLALHALAKQPDSLHRLVLIAGKVQNPGNIADAVYAANPTFKTSLQRLASALKQLRKDERAKVLIAKPRSDRVVPLPDMTLNG